MNEVTRFLSAIEQGEPHAAAQLLPLVYDELRKLATARMAQEKPGHTLEATALVHEAYVRLVDQDPARHWDHRGHFFAAAAEAMRRILVENARRKQSLKHGGGRHRISLDEAHRVLESPYDLLELDDALDRLAREDSNAADMVKLRLSRGFRSKKPPMPCDLPEPPATGTGHSRAWLRCEFNGRISS